MKKYIVLSVNDNPDYLYYVPLTCWAWKQFGWEPIIFFNRQNNDVTLETIEFVFQQLIQQEIPSHVARVHQIDGYRSDTVTQVSRLYAHLTMTGMVDPDYKMPADMCSYLMTGDIDMLPLSDYWKPNLSDYHHVAPTMSIFIRSQ